jgi:mono/diheme cytochrome c family protein
VRRALLIGMTLGAAGAMLAPAAEAQGPMSSSQPPASAAAGGFDVHQLFANTCGWCHSNGGRAPGKGPQLMGTSLTDEQIAYRIRHGKPGAMPAFGSTFDDAQIAAIIAYIRALKPEEGATR